MKDVHTARTLADAYVVRDALQRAGIPASIRNEFLVNTPGIMPINETWPRVSVGDDHVEEARILLAEFVRTDEGALTLDDMDGGDGEAADGVDAQTLMTDLFQAAGHFRDAASDGGDVDDVRRLGEQILAMPVPFGVEAEAWDRIGSLALETATTAAGGDDEGAAALAAQLRGALDGLV